MATKGAFGHENGPKQCTAMSKRSKRRCEGPAVLGSPNQRCRMHGGKGEHAIGTRNASFKHGRSSKYLPAQLGDLYAEAISNPDLLEMSSHIALLEARMHELLGESTSDNPVPRWVDLQSAGTMLGQAMKLPMGTEREQRVAEANDALQNVLKAGKAWDSTWSQVVELMDSIRKLTDTEVKRKKELNQLIPVERVIVLMMAVGDTVKRCVSNPTEIQKVQQEFAKLIGSGVTDHGTPRVSADIIDIAPDPSPKPKSNKRKQETVETVEVVC